MQRWLLTNNGTIQNDRNKQGAMLRARVAQLKMDFDLLAKGLNDIDKRNEELQVSRKTLVDFRDELSKAQVEFQELQQCAKNMTMRETPQNNAVVPLSHKSHTSASGA